MNKELQDKLRMVAEYDGWEYKENGLFYKDNHKKTGIMRMKYHTSWSWQIPVWAKLCKDAHRIVMALYEVEYYNAINTNNPQAGFEIICRIIEQIKKKQ